MPTQLISLIPAIATPLALLAFIIAAIILAHARIVGRAKDLIESAPTGKRGQLVWGALEIMDLNEREFDQEKRFQLAVKTLKHRSLRSWFLFVFSLVIALALTTLATIAFIKGEPESELRKILADDRMRVMPILKGQGIYEAKDKDLVDYLADQTTLELNPAANISESQRIELAENAYGQYPSVVELRRRAKLGAEPFRELGELKTASIPSERVHQPLQYFVHVPMDSRYEGRMVKIADPLTNNSIVVFARGVNDSSTDAIHLNREQMTYLHNEAPGSGRLQIALRTTKERAFDPACSQVKRADLAGLADELCDIRGESVTAFYLQQINERRNGDVRQVAIASTAR